MDRRLKLQEVLTNILGSNNVYFQPPPTIQMSYPCIVYERNSSDVRFADNRSYTHMYRYTITYIDRNPDNGKILELLDLPMCTHDRFYVSNGLNHDVFNIYF